MTALHDEQHALALDAADPLSTFRGDFLVPTEHGRDQVYLCGNSLGLQPRGARAAVLAELDDWADFAVEAHFKGRRPWWRYHEFVRDQLARVAGALPSEVVAMNSLTANLHLMMASFYRPTAQRPLVLIEKHAFPSDRHAVESQIRFHGFDPAEALVEIEGDEPGGAISAAALERAIAEHAPRLALVLMPGVQYRTGQVFDMPEIVRLGHAAGAVVGFDLAHAIGNLHLTLHDDGGDFAVWCSYKYLNAGPGAVAGCFVHERHAHSGLPRLAGWWGHDPESRFRMGPEFVPAPGADGWQLSNPPILALAPLLASLEVFDRAGMAALRAKSERLTGYLEALVRARLDALLDVLTPSAPARRGCQLSLRVRAGREQGRALFEHLQRQGIVGDWREPDVLRFSPTPLYNRYMDVWRLVRAIEEWASTT